MLAPTSLRSWTSPCFLDSEGLERSSLRGPPCKARQLVFLVGAQGAGKTTTWRERGWILAQVGLSNYIVLDGELFYEAHGGHQVLQQVQGRSCTSHLSLAEDMRRWKKAAANRACSMGLNILLPVTGTSPITDSKSVADFRQMGYKLCAVFLLVSPQQSSANARGRQELTGRPPMDWCTYLKTCSLMEELQRKVDGPVLYINNDSFEWEVLSGLDGQARLKQLSQQSASLSIAE